MISPELDAAIHARELAEAEVARLKEAKRAQENAAAVLIAVLVERAGGSVTLLASDLERGRAADMEREHVSKGGLRLRIVKPRIVVPGRKTP